MSNNKLAIAGGIPVNTEPWPRWPVSGRREREMVDKVLASEVWGGTGMGPMIRELNERFAQYCGAKAGAAVANGTISMALTLRAWGIGPGDEVILPAYTFMATAVAVHDIGATPVYVDIDPDTLNLHPGTVAGAIGPRTRAVIPVHLAGHPCAMDEINALARRHGLKVLEDAAQAHGAIYKGRMVGNLADAASFSFQQSKNLQSGEGGIVISDDTGLIDLIHFSLGKFGRGLREDYRGHVHHRHGTNACFTEIQAAIALAQLERLEEQTQRRAANARLLYETLGTPAGVTPLRWQPGCDRHGHHLFLFRHRADQLGGASRAQVIAALNAEGIPASSLYPMPLFEQPLYCEQPELPHRELDCPATREACSDTYFLEQNVLLAEPRRMAVIAEAMTKVLEQPEQLLAVDADEAAFMGSSVLTRARETSGRVAGNSQTITQES